MAEYMTERQMAGMWIKTTMPKPPRKLFIIEADYKKNPPHPRYEVCARTKQAAVQWFERTFGWLKVFAVVEAPDDYQPNVWFLRQNQTITHKGDEESEKE